MAIAAAVVLMHVCTSFAPVQHRAIGNTHHSSQGSLSRQLALATGSTVSCVVEHTRLSLRRFDSSRDVPSGTRVPCLALTNIDVDARHRRQGHAHTAMRALRLVAADTDRALIVENVVSPHMHALIEELDGEPLWGSRRGAKGCHYWLPPSSATAWQDLAQRA